MHYPWWYVPDVTAPMLIAAVAVAHVLVSHYAVGGGLFLAVETTYAYRTKDRAYLDYLRGHTQFFVLLTVVFGAITGVGIWWTIGLASPLATETLIRTFVFAWATEYVFFVLELVSAFVFLYCWGKLAERTHAIVGWIYGLSAWVSLVLIVGITAFMLHPGRWPEDHSFWSAFFNPQFLPQVVVRTGGALLLSSLYVYLHASLANRDRPLHERICRRSARPALLGAAMVGAGALGWYAMLPESAKAALASAAVLNIFAGLLLAVSAAVVVLVYLGPYRNPDWVSPGFAIALFLFGIAGVGIGEFVREAVRKPYVIYNVVLGNQILPAEVATLRKEGYLQGGLWTRALVKSRHPEVFAGGRIEPSRLLALPEDAQAALGEVLFQYHCNDCHALDRGYSPVGALLRGYSRPMINSLITHLDQERFFMPPWSGTPEEAHLLASYLSRIAPPRPKGMAPQIEPAGTRQ